jgi:CRP/FNR family transcriptional regulator
MSDEIQAKVAKFFDQYPKRVYPKGQIIIFKGDNPGKIFYIVSGKICKYDITYRGDEIITHIYHDSALFSMSLALSTIKNHFFYKAEENTTVRYAPPQDVITFFLTNPEVMLEHISQMYQGIDGILGRVVQLMAGNARSRLIYELVIECRRFGKLLQDGSYLLDIHEKHLAARSGLSRETISRGMKRLKEAGIIRIDTDGIRVNDLDALTSLLQPEG